MTQSRVTVNQQARAFPVLNHEELVATRRRSG
jgi:hypothetical protein